MVGDNGKDETMRRNEEKGEREDGKSERMRQRTKGRIGGWRKRGGREKENERK